MSRKTEYATEVADLRKLLTATQIENIQFKDIVKRVLLEGDNSRKLMYALNNPDLEKQGASPADYYMVNIFPYLINTEAQSNVKNTIMYDTLYSASPEWNSGMKFQYIRFLILCPPGDNEVDKLTGIPRHDLIAAVINDSFAGTNFFGFQCRLYSDKGGSTDSAFASRDMYFEVMAANNRVRDGYYQNNIVRTDYPQ